MGMTQTKHTGLVQKHTQITCVGQTHRQNFDSDLGVIMEMLSQVNVAKTATTEPLE
jgi:hypothetical protein